MPVEFSDAAALLIIRIEAARSAQEQLAREFRLLQREFREVQRDWQAASKDLPITKRK